RAASRRVDRHAGSRAGAMPLRAAAGTGGGDDTRRGSGGAGADGAALSGRPAIIGAVMWTPTLVLIAITTLAACVTLGGGLYEFLVVDPAWPKRPGIIQPRNGGVSRARFWIPAHTIFEVLLIATLVMAWGEADVRIAVLVALVSHAVMRVWSLF